MIWESGEEEGERCDVEGRESGEGCERDVREGVRKRGLGRDEIGNIMLLNNESRANKLDEISINNIISSLFVNEKIYFFTIFKSYKYTFLTLTYDFHF